MDLLCNLLNEIAYHYYPQELDETDTSYVNTLEHKNFQRLHSKWLDFRTALDPVCDKLKEHFNQDDIVLNGVPNHTPSYHIEVTLDTNEKQKKVVAAYISLFIPFYHLVVLEENKQDSKITYNYSIPEGIKSIFEEAIGKTMEFRIFPKELLKMKIPRVEIYPEFNYFNAFFTDWYRITNEET
ncbi:hypothetical protein [Flagellimonas sp. S3867]|uniref:hypothetical protein n=1 Tax=Flagellimonas sp. S3867 TaxID=2768063 RepID=UPI0016821D49|nr:hypothetical protein [Flagellimonas sp. S3867]